MRKLEVKNLRVEYEKDQADQNMDRLVKEMKSHTEENFGSSEYEIEQ